MRPGRAAVARGSRTIPPDLGALFHTSILAACGSDRRYRSLLLSGLQKHRLEVGLSLPNSIPDPSHNTGGGRTSFWHK